MKLKRALYEDDTAAREAAHKMGLKHVGWGRWADPKTGQVVAKTINGKLEKSGADDPDYDAIGMPKPKKPKQMTDKEKEARRAAGDYVPDDDPTLNKDMKVGDAFKKLEVAPPGKKYETMIKQLKGKYGKDSDIPYKIAWSQKNKEKK